MKGILGHMRGETYVPSGYDKGDKGGSAGGYGIHGMKAGLSGSDAGGMPEQRYSGGDLGFEGGVRGGGDFETMPAMYPYPKKKGYDEHSVSREESIHGVPGVDGMADMGAGDQGSADHGMAGGMHCMAGKCGFSAKSSHGLARHIVKKHGYGAFTKHGLGAAIDPQPLPPDHGMRHGDSYSGQEYRGESDSPKEMAGIKAEYAAAHAKIGANPTERTFSSYERRDQGGAMGGLGLKK